MSFCSFIIEYPHSIFIIAPSLVDSDEPSICMEKIRNSKLNTQIELEISLVDIADLLNPLEFTCEQYENQQTQTW